MSDRGQSSVLGVLLLVALVVLLAATVGIYVFGVAEESNEASPSTSMTVETCSMCSSLADPDPGATTNFINITFTNGDTMKATQVSILLDDTLIFDPSKTGPEAYQQPANYDGAGDNDLRWSSDYIQAGERLILEDDADSESGDDVFQSGQTLRVVWTSPESGKTFVLVERTLQF